MEAVIKTNLKDVKRRRASKAASACRTEGGEGDGRGNGSQRRR